MSPTFAAGSITGEKERKTYELLLASPLKPATILVGKLLSSLSYLVILIVSSLPLMILCYLLGGLLLSEIMRSYLVLILAAGTFGLLSIACSSYFRRTSSALVVSYLVILPLAVLCVVLTRTDNVIARDFVSIAILPPWCLAAWTVLGILINRRLLHPPDVGSEGKDVVDEEEEMKYAIGVVIDRDLFPDKLFAPAKRTDLMPDGTNPVLDKELRSEIFSQGTLMLRVVIQVSMLLSIPMMAVLLFLRSDQAAYYVAYVLTFNLLVGPGVFGGEHHPGAGTSNPEPAAYDPAGPGTDRGRQADGGPSSLDSSDVPAHRTAPAGLCSAARAAGSVLDPAGFPVDHRDDLPGHIDRRAHVLGAWPGGLRGDGPDVSHLAVSLRGAGGSGTVFAGNLLDDRPNSWLPSRSPARSRRHWACRCTRHETSLDRASRSWSTIRFWFRSLGHFDAGLGDLPCASIRSCAWPSCCGLSGVPLAMVCAGGLGYAGGPLAFEIFFQLPWRPRLEYSLPSARVSEPGDFNQSPPPMPNSPLKTPAAKPRAIILMTSGNSVIRSTPPRA